MTGISDLSQTDGFIEHSTQERHVLHRSTVPVRYNVLQQPH